MLRKCGERVLGKDERGDEVLVMRQSRTVNITIEDLIALHITKLASYGIINTCMVVNFAV